MLHIGTAGWSVPRDLRERVGARGTALERYASVLNAVEINSTFARVHRPGTFARWADAAGPTFSFSVKVPRSITHEQRLLDVDALIDDFLEGAQTPWRRRWPSVVAVAAQPPVRGGVRRKCVQPAARAGPIRRGLRAAPLQLVQRRGRSMAGGPPHRARRGRSGETRGSRRARGLARSELLPASWRAPRVLFGLRRRRSGLARNPACEGCRP